MSEKSVDPSRHRFFRAMVVMGSGLALGCGGVSERDGSPGNTDSGSGGSRGGAGGSSGGSTNTGGVAGSTPVTGGTFSIGGSAGTATGGSGGDKFVEPNCPSQQWASPDFPQCDGAGGGLVLPGNVVCNLTLPLSISDCAEGQRFACLKATSNADGTLRKEVTPYGCECVPNLPSCREECGQFYSYDANCEEVSSGDGALGILCGCTVVVLK